MRKMLIVSRLEHGFGYLKIFWGNFKLITRLYLIHLPYHGFRPPSTITLISRFLIGRSILPHFPGSSLVSSFVQNLTLFLFELLGHLVAILIDCSFERKLEAYSLIIGNFVRTIDPSSFLGFLFFEASLLPFAVKPLSVRLRKILVPLFLVFSHAPP